MALNKDLTDRGLVGGLIADENSQYLRLDPSTHNVITTTNANSNINEGKYYTAFISATSIGISSGIEIVLITPDSGVGRMHVMWEFDTSSGASLVIKSGATAGLLLKRGAGTLHGVVNSDNAGTCTIYDNTSAVEPRISYIDAAKALGTLTYNAPFSSGLFVVTTGLCRLTFTYE